MKTNFRFARNTMGMLMALAFSAIWAMPVLADDDLPPSTQQISTNETPPSNDGGTVQLVNDEVSAASQPDLADIAQTPIVLPTATDMIVLDEEGQALPLATQQAAGAIASQDPMWCPLGVKPG